MPFDGNSLAAIQPQLLADESVLWSGQPKRVILHSDDLYLIPFSLLWGGFAVYWELTASGFFGSQHGQSAWFMQLWGIPFVVLGQYFIWGRFLYAAWMRGRTYYAITNQRVMVVQNGMKPRVASAFIKSLPGVAKEMGRDGVGTLRFALTPSYTAGLGNRRQMKSLNPYYVGDGPAFVDIEDVNSVYQLISQKIGNT